MLLPSLSPRHLGASRRAAASDCSGQALRTFRASMAALLAAFALAAVQQARASATLETPLRAVATAPPAAPTSAQAQALQVTVADAQRADRITGGVNAALLQSVAQLGYGRWLETQLRPAPPVLPSEVMARIGKMQISRQSLGERVQESARAQESAKSMPDETQKKAALKAYQQGLNRQADEAAERWLLQAVNSPNQVQERMVWFWLNHFNIGQQKGNLRAFVGDYEQALRPHALGKFSDLLTTAALHPAMLRYLDNQRNAVGQINENFARELMELHTLGVHAGYTQADVQELARVLTGVGVRMGPGKDRVRPDSAGQYVREGLFEFNPARHDKGPKRLLGQPVKAGGLDEVRDVLARLARAPATARHISTKLARYFIGDTVPPALVDRVAQRFLATDGDIAAVLHTLFTAAEFDASLGKRFKDPWQYVLSATRLAYDGNSVTDAKPLLNALVRLGQRPFGRATPDGWPMTETAWSSPGQMTARFEVARAIVGEGGRGNPNFFTQDNAASSPRTAPAAPVESAAWRRAHEPRLGAGTRHTLAEMKASGGDWAWAAIVSPEFMRH